MYRIGSFSRITGISVRTLRYYDEVGLLRPAHIESSTSYRYYHGSQVNRLNRIVVLRDLGFSIAEIRRLLAQKPSLAQIADSLRLRHEELERRVAYERARLTRSAARLDLFERAGLGAALDVAVRSVSPRLVASIRDTVPAHADSRHLFEELERHTAHHVRRFERAAVWHACGHCAIDCEVLVFLRHRVPDSRRVSVYELPRARVASLVYRGDHDFMPAYRALRSWIAATGLEVNGPKREIYLDEGTRDSEAVTEIQFPIASDPDGSGDVDRLGDAA
jgi:DNA-binding transcriptional MerR regulator